MYSTLRAAVNNNLNTHLVEITQINNSQFIGCKAASFRNSVMKVRLIV